MENRPYGEINSGKSRKEMAMEYFLQGYNCSQSIAMAFIDLIDEREISREAFLKISSGFGGGMGRLREVCGSVSGMVMLIGYLKGYSGPETGQKKAELYRKIQDLAKKFEEKNGSIVCRELLNLSVKRESPVPEERTQEYYKKRPCRELIGMSAEIIDEFLREMGEKEEDGHN